jgi:hypothetical protein
MAGATSGAVIDESRHGEDIEGEIHADDVAHEDVDQARIRAEQIDEGDRGEKGRREIRERCRCLYERFARHICAAHGPSERNADSDAEKPDPGAENQ